MSKETKDQMAITTVIFNDELKKAKDADDSKDEASEAADEDEAQP